MSVLKRHPETLSWTRVESLALDEAQKLFFYFDKMFILIKKGKSTFSVCASK